MGVVQEIHLNVKQRFVKILTVSIELYFSVMFMILMSS